MEIVSLSPSDSRYRSYLLGNFSAGQRAIPTRSWNYVHPVQRVTFKIYDLDSIGKPSAWAIWCRALRLHNVGLSMLPMVATAVFIWSVLNYPINWTIWFCAVFAVLSWHLGINLFNDFQDHMSGLDRLAKQGGSGVIQKGWLAAYEVRRASFLFFALSLFFVGPLLFYHWQLVTIFAVLSGLLLVEYDWLRLSYRLPGLGELLFFLCSGPALVIGIVVLLGLPITAEFVCLGLVFGFLALLSQHLKNSENLILNGKQKTPGLASRLGFDKAKKFASLLCWGAVLSWLGFTFSSGNHLSGLAILTIMGGFYLPLWRRLQRASAPIASDFVDMHMLATGLHALFGTLFVLLSFL